MNLANALSFYITTNLVIGLAYVTLRIAGRTRGTSRFLSARSLLRLHTTALLLVMTAPIAMLFAPKQPFFQPPAKIWSAPSARQFVDVFSSELGRATQPGYLLVADNHASTALLASNISTSGLICIALIFSAGLWLLIRDIRRLIAIRRMSYLIRKIGHTAIYISDEVSVPFSYRTLRAANVVVPSALLTKPEQYRIGIQHELQHHRQGDTKIVYAMWLLRLTCVANPIVHLWARELSEIQEFACDETLVDLRKVDSRAYASCLFEVAQTAEGLKRVPACATGLTFKTDGPLLKRRINTMLFQKKVRQNQFFASLTAMGLAAILAGGAYASTGLVQDRRVSADQARKMVAEYSSRTSSPSFPIAMNERVLRQLNRFIGTPEGREFMRDALARMENERGPIERAMKKYGVPKELLAMPLIESGYQNLPQKPGSRNVSAGLWQFIPRTAQIYGLVDEIDASGKVVGRDDRTNIPLETDAAMRYLVANKMRFNDWMLSVSAYNAGEERVQEGIDKTGSRDAWELVGKGFEGDHDYLAKLHAAILIMNNPSSVR